MKITIEIADDLFERAQRLAQKERTTLRALTEEGLRMLLKDWEPDKPKKLPALVTFQGEGLTDEFKTAPWEKIRDEIYRGHSA
jgi:predicted transcriptional regulator